MKLTLPTAGSRFGRPAGGTEKQRKQADGKRPAQHLISSKSTDLAVGNIQGESHAGDVRAGGLGRRASVPADTGGNTASAIYGYLNWDKPAPAEEIREIDEEVQWEKSGEQHEIERGAK